MMEDIVFLWNIFWAILQLGLSMAAASITLMIGFGILAVPAVWIVSKIIKRFRISK